MMGPLKRLEVSMDELERIIERAKTTALTVEECKKLRKAFETLAYLTDLVGEKNTTIAKLRKIFFGASTEKIRNILDNQGADSASDSTSGSTKTEKTAKPKAKGHGRNGAEEYTGNVRFNVYPPFIVFGLLRSRHGQGRLNTKDSESWNRGCSSGSPILPSLI